MRRLRVHPDLDEAQRTVKADGRNIVGKHIQRKHSDGGVEPDGLAHQCRAQHPAQAPAALPRRHDHAGEMAVGLLAVAHLAEAD
jgi:hypothetical protein